MNQGFDPTTLSTILGPAMQGAQQGVNQAQATGVAPELAGHFQSINDIINGVTGAAPPAAGGLALGQVPGMGNVPAANTQNMAIPGQGAVDSAAAYDKSAAGGGTPMSGFAQILGMEALKQLDQAQRRPIPTMQAAAPQHPMPTQLHIPTPVGLITPPKIGG